MPPTVIGRLPFVIGLDVRLRLGPDRDAQEMKSFLKPRPNDATVVLNASQIKQRLDRNAQNNFDDIVKRANAVRLTPAQVTTLRQMGAEFDRRRDSIYVGLSAYMASLSGNYLTTAAKNRWHDAFVAVARNYVLAGPAVRELLSDEQFDMESLKRQAEQPADSYGFTVKVLWYPSNPRFAYMVVYTGGPQMWFQSEQTQPGT